ncbi:hypothetical protein L1987_80790 [Smallanthus sonchifolius]|uniref:Uncharacterized protein n=1 Tax=Smallanthus sonchifolius TaxID=185202 RepID=A0ACB8YQ86_9ASTR|nr:hypothetical protein L1987_80790 [Smallanthus sonchifolius]
MKEADGNTGYTPEESGGRKGPKKQQKVIKDKLFDDEEEDTIVKNDENGGRKRPKRQRKVIKDKLCDDAEEDAVMENDETGGRKRSKRQRKVIQEKLYDDAEEDDVVENDGTGEKINRKRKRGVGKKKGLSKTPNAPKAIAKRIKRDKEDDGMLFKIDFLAQFMSLVVEIQKHGKCKIDFIRCFTDETKLEDIDSCSYILNSMKTCKNGWNRCNVKSKFTGALMILVLLYVDRIVCKSMNVERKMGPLKFWTMERLRERENFEKDDGGFGSGELRDVYVSLKGDESEAKDDSIETVVEVKDDDGKNRHDLTDHLSIIDDELECILKHKIAIKKALCDAHIAFQEDDCVKSRITRYTSIFKEVIEIEKYVTQDNWT